ncbi:MAG: hypothetical protein HYR96_10290 [Deltaproteobacteria bacterium]|nr:hypothetical protein [Deltaproteobacteria bacterium]MBI3295619.1 hypothetical protein [Deltaproteobacteria bacterium]
MVRLHVVLLFSVILVSQSWSIQVNVGEAPETDRELTLRAIRSARTNLLLNIYELTSDDIADALIDRIDAGVHVEILEEGQPTAGMSAAGKRVMNRVVAAMNERDRGDHFYLMTSKAGGKRRFRFDHGKYAVIDGKSLLIGSENYSPTGQPAPGVLGNRGWEAWIHDRDSASAYAAVFHKDAVLDFNDVQELVTGKDLAASFNHFLNMAAQLALAADVEGKPEVMNSIEADRVKMITSPNTSLEGLLDVINTARTNLEIEQMTFAIKWGTSTYESPLVDAVIKAARRGVSVRVLLNDDKVFSSNGKNVLTVDRLNKAAEKEDLDLEARTADVKAMKVSYIHNKGALADSDQTLVSSINWNENSVQHNREAAVLIHSDAVHQHFVDLFNHDWEVSDPDRTATSP